MNEYQKRKARAREKAIQFQYNISKGVLYSWYDIWNIQNYFSKLAKRYGLIKEFTENGII